MKSIIKKIKWLLQLAELSDVCSPIYDEYDVEYIKSLARRITESFLERNGWELCREKSGYFTYLSQYHKGYIIVGVDCGYREFEVTDEKGKSKKLSTEQDYHNYFQQ